LPEPDLLGRRWSWTREPTSWELTGETLVWRCQGGTDYWRKTEGLPPVHNGCSLLTPVERDFELELLVDGAFADRYDQAGLMVLASEQRWLKAGIELDGDLHLSAVNTHDESDWSREPWKGSAVRLRVARIDETIEVSAEADGKWRVFRTLSFSGPVGIGPYSCAPKGSGFEARARAMRVTA